VIVVIPLLDLHREYLYKTSLLLRARITLILLSGTTTFSSFDMSSTNVKKLFYPPIITNRPTNLL